MQRRQTLGLNSLKLNTKRPSSYAQVLEHALSVVHAKLVFNVCWDAAQNAMGTNSHSYSSLGETDVGANIACCAASNGLEYF